MKDKGKGFIILLISAIILLIIGLIMGTNESKDQEITSTLQNKQTEQNGEIFTEILEDGTKLNTSNKIGEPKILDGMEITGLQLTVKDNTSFLLGKITNVSNEIKGEYQFNVIILDKNGKELITIKAYVKELQPGESTELNTSATFDYSNAYDIKFSRE